jgi:hypothetical protein
MGNEQQDSDDEVKETDIKPNHEFISSSLSGTSNKSSIMKSKKERKLNNQFISSSLWNKQQESNDELKENDIKPNNEFMSYSF